jgi:short-subunit dehydrogenase
LTANADTEPLRVFITGASSGIGAALVRHYAERGACLGLFARRAAALEELVRECVPERCASYAGDVRDADALLRSAADFVQRFGVPHVVIANAGVSRGTLTECRADLESFAAVMDTNVLGMVRTFQPFLAAMREARSGTLVGVASVAGFRGLPGSGAYCASKAAAIAYLESLRVELRGTGVVVVTLCPGYVDTPMTRINPYRMPFLMSADVAARKMAQAIDRKRRRYVLPWQMAVVAQVLRLMPAAIFDRAFACAPRKPR